MHTTPEEYTFHCVKGHKGSAKPGSDLERHCKEESERTGNAETTLFVDKCPQCPTFISGLVGDSPDGVVDHRSFDESYYDGSIHLDKPLLDSPSSFRIGF